MPESPVRLFFFNFRTWVVGALFTTILLSGNARVVFAGGDESNDGNRQLPDDSIGIINLSDQDVSSELRDCLKHENLGKCLQKQIGDNSSKPTTFKDRVSNQINDDLVSQWRDFMYDGINPSQDVWSNGQTAANYGFLLGGDRIDMDEVAQDPYKLETEQNTKQPGIWVRHHFEVFPQIGYGFVPGKAGITNKQGYYGGVFTVNGILRVIKRHPMDQVYNQDFWGYVRSDTQIIKQDFPMYFSIGAHLDGQGLLPGEGFEFERYGSIAIGLGPNISLTGIQIPVSITQFDAGIFGSGGLAVSAVVGHFRTIMEARDDGKLRLTLENINQDSEKLYGEISAGLVLGPLSFVESLIHLETGVIHTREKILDMTVDPKYPEASRALHYAYMGFFGPLQSLALAADTNYKGVRDLTHTSIKETTHERDFQVITYDRGSQTSESVETSDTGTNITSDAMDEHRNTLRSQKQLDVLVRTDNIKDPTNNRYLSVKYHFDSNDAKPEELREFLDLGKIVAPTNQPVNYQDQLAQWTSTLENDHPKDKRGELKGYFYLSFDASAVATLLEIPAGQKNSQLMINWAKAMNLPNAASWGTMSDTEQDAAAANVPDLAKHLDQIRKFGKAILNAISTRDAVGQARVFTKTVRGVDYDLYPVAALAMGTDHSHIMALERISLKKDSRTNTLEFANIGDHYAFQPKDPY